jgi:cytochrome P450
VAPVAWHEEAPRRPGGRSGPGFWCVTRHADIHAVSVDTDTYSSWLGGFTGADISGGVLEETRLNLMAMDPPEHTALRRAIREPFSAKGVDRLKQAIERIALEVVDSIAHRGEAEFVDEVASEVPLRILAHLLGVAEADRRTFYAWSNAIIGNHDPDFGGTVADFLAAKDALFAYGREVIAYKRAHPGDDFLSQVVHGEVNGEPIDDERIVMMWYLFLVAANETTRSTLSGALQALTDWPDQRTLLLSDLDAHLPGFIEETLRVNNAVLHFRRTATRDTTLGGAQIRAGDKVLLWYPSANRDEAVFANPDRFDLTRSPNLHLAFGVGAHFCLGARLGRLSVATTLRALLTRLPDITVSGPVVGARSNFLHWVKQMPVRFTPA